MDARSAEVFIAYLEANPLVALLLLLVVVLLMGSLIKKLVKWTLILVMILVGFLYFTHEKAEEDWQVRLKLAQDKALKLGQDALKKGQEALETHGKEVLEKGKKAIEERLSE
tara:strand:+ start:508 stop:843 length:336 start_codon:yes stop_codon:yes gene_type:complete